MYVTRAISLISGTSLLGSSNAPDVVMDEALSLEQVKANLAKLYGQLSLVEDILDSSGMFESPFR